MKYLYHFSQSQTYFKSKNHSFYNLQPSKKKHSRILQKFNNTINIESMELLRAHL